MAQPAETLRHVAIIMDGNGRWAAARGLSRVKGHKAGAEAVVRTLKAAKKLGIKNLTLYAFSTENWKRPREEVDALMELLDDFLRNRLPEIEAEQLKFKVVGRMEQLPEFIRQDIAKAIDKTKNNINGTLTLALNYGGRAEIVDAAKKISGDFAAGKLTEINEDIFRKYLYDPEMEDPDLLIRTSGECRLSNFMLWQLSYSEIYFTDLLWPDFDYDELKRAVEFFISRQRRFGGL